MRKRHGITVALAFFVGIQIEDLAAKRRRTNLLAPKGSAKRRALVRRRFAHLRCSDANLQIGDLYT